MKHVYLLLCAFLIGFAVSAQILPTTKVSSNTELNYSLNYPDGYYFIWRANGGGVKIMTMTTSKYNTIIWNEGIGRGYVEVDVYEDVVTSDGSKKTVFKETLFLGVDVVDTHINAASATKVELPLGPAVRTLSVQPSAYSEISSYNWGPLPSGITSGGSTSKDLTIYIDGCAEGSITVKGYSSFSGRESNAVTFSIVRILPIIKSNSLSCNGGSFSLSYLPAGATVNWSVSGPIAISGAATGSSVNVIADGQGLGAEVGATINYCGKSYTLPVLKLPFIGAPTLEVQYSQSYPYPCSGEPVSLRAEYTGINTGITVTARTSNGTVELYPVGYDIAVPENTLWVTTSVSNACGAVSKRYYIKYSECGGDGGGPIGPPGPGPNFTNLSVYPNPSSSELRVEVADANVDTEVKLYDSKGKLRKTGKIKNGKSVIKTSDLPEGVYFLHTNKDGKVEKQQVLIKR